MGKHARVRWAIPVVVALVASLGLIAVPGAQAEDVVAPSSSASPSPTSTPSEGAPAPESSAPSEPVALSEPAPSAAPTGISGRVTDNSGNPLEGIYVEARSGGSYTYLLTSADGTYAFTSLTAGTWTVGFFPGPSKPYANEYYDNVFPTPSATPITVVDGQMTTGVDASLDSGGTIAGRITRGTDQAAMAGLMVCAQAATHSNCNSTDADGNYLLYGLSPDNYVLWASYTATTSGRYYGGTTIQSQATVIAMSGATAFTGINVTVWPPESTGVSGRVTDAGGNPIEGISVQAAGANTMRYDTTDVNGEYLITDLSSGPWRIGFFPPDASAYAWEYYDDKRSDPGYTPVTVVDGAVTPSINASLSVGRSIRGTITDGEGGSGLAGIYVCAYGYSSQTAGNCANSGPDGSYVISALVAASYRVVAQATEANATTYYRQGTSGTAAYNLATAVVVGDTTDTTGIDVVMPRAGSMAGHVRSQDGSTALSGVLVCANSPTGEGGNCNMSGSDGSYVITGLPTGSYIVNTNSDSGYLVQFFDGQSSRAAATAVSVTAGQRTSGIDFRLAPFVPGTITGTVRSSVDNSPLGGIQVCVEDGQTGTCQTTDFSGHYSFSSLPAGTYWLRTPQSPSWLEQYYDRASNWGAKTTVTLTAGQTISGIDFSLKPFDAGFISGRVTDEITGAPLVGVNVCESNVDTWSGSCTLTDGTGAYRFSAVQAGDHQVNVPQTATHLGEYYGDKPTGWQSTRVTVVGGEETSGIDFALTPYTPGTYSGRVTAAGSGAAISSAWVCGYDVDGRGNCVPSGGDGSYQMVNLKPGTYKVSVYPPDGFAPQYYPDKDFYVDGSTVGVLVGQDTPGIDFHLKRGGKMSGRVVDESNAPVAGTWVCSIPMASPNSRTCTSSGGDGSWQSPTVVPGNYKVGADGNATLAIGYYANAYQIKDATEVPVAADVTTPNLTITLKPRGSLAAAITWTPTNTTVPVVVSSMTPDALAQLDNDGAIEYVVSDAGTTGCTVDRWTATLTFSGVGSCVVTASSFESAYKRVSTSVTFSIVKSPASVSWSPTKTSATTAATQLDPGTLATTTSDGAIVYSVTDAGTTGCTIDPASGIITYSAAGSCKVAASVPETTKYLASQTSVTFTISGATPTITSISPTSGGPGTSVTMMGTNLTGATAVAFGGTPALFTVLSPTSIVTSVPVSAKTGSITVTTPGGTASSPSFTASKTKKPPTVTSFSPTSGTADTLVSITGTNLAGATSVKVGTVTLTSGWSVLSSTQLTVRVPAGAGSGTIAVTTAGGTGTSATVFTVPGAKVATTLAYGGATSARKGAKITLKSTLTAAGSPVAGETVSFSLNGSSITAVTSSTGIASVATTAPAGAGTYTVNVGFAGSGQYEASTTSGTLVVK